MSQDDPRLRILNAAGPVFAEQGFKDATVRDICKSADVNLASVNYYFGDKERLYIEAVKRAHEMCVEMTPHPAWPEDTPPQTKLFDHVRTMLTRMLGQNAAPWQPRLMMREILNPTAACRELAEEYFRPHFQLLLGILSEMLPDGVPAERLHQIGFSVVGQCLYYRVAGEVAEQLVGEQEYQTHYTVEGLTRHIVGLTLAALGAAPALSESLASPSAKKQLEESRS